MRTKLIALIAIPLVLTIGLAGCASSGTATSAKAVKPIAASATPTADPESLAIPAERFASPENPAPAGTLLALKDASGTTQFTVLIGQVIPDAEAQLKAKDPVNAASSPGWQFMMVPVKYTYVGKTDGMGFVSTFVRYALVSAAGTVYRDYTVVLAIPNDTATYIFTGKPQTRNSVIAVHPEDIATGLLRLTTAAGNYYVKIS